MRGEGFCDSSESFTINYKFIGWITGDGDLIVEGVVTDSIKALIFGGFDIFEFFDIFGYFIHKKIGGIGFDFIGQWHGERNIFGNNFYLVDIAIGDGDNVHTVHVLNFGSTKPDGEDLADIITIFYIITDIIIAVRDNFKTTDNVFKSILESETDDDGCDADAGEHGANVDTKNLKDGKKSHDANECADDVFKHAEIGFVLFVVQDFRVLLFPGFEKPGDDSINNTAKADNNNCPDDAFQEPTFYDVLENVHGYIIAWF